MDCARLGRKRANGKTIKVANDRRLISDLSRVAQNIPLAGLNREIELGQLSLLRAKTRPRICWDVLMMRAYALVAQENPLLRQVYTRLPWPHIYQHDHNVCMITMAREYRGKERLFFARFGAPDQHSLTQLQDQYDHLRQAPIETIKQFRHQIRFAKWPLPIRRFAWWLLFNAWPSKRASHMGTFGMSISLYKDAMGTKHLGQNTTILGVDPRPRNGKSRLLLTFDHRILDGKPAATVLEQLRMKLQTGITHEVKQLLRDQGLNPEKILQDNSHRLNRRAA